LRKRVIAVVVIGILVVGLMGYNSFENRSNDGQAKEQASGAMVGDKIPEFALSGLDGKKVTIGKENKVAVLNFWATWCPPCRAEFPELVSFSQKNNTKIQFYSINLQENKEKVLSFFKQENYSLPVLLDEDGKVAKMFRVTAIPTTLIIDAQGIIRYRKSGGVTSEELENIIKKL
jgi:DsbE subfamily thiol:disulfide oxidoreductase